MKLLFVTLIALLLCSGDALIIKNGTTIKQRFALPNGFERLIGAPNSYAAYLQNLPLKPYGAKVKYFDGREKHSADVYVSVVDMPIGRKDLHQCADAVMRLRAEYLYAQKHYEAIRFNFLADGKPRFFKDYAKGDYGYDKFWKYMEYVFASANTRSLHDELQPVDINQMQIGDVLIQKGVPFGHAVVVVDMAVHTQTKQKLYLLAQSYMPAQEIQILSNPNNDTLSPWYELNQNEIITPEWDFKPVDLRRFK